MPALLPLVLLGALLARCAAPAHARWTSPKDAKAAFAAAGLVPSVVPVFEPTVALGVTYPFNDTVTFKLADLGTNFTVPEVYNAPHYAVDAPALHSGDKFVVVMFDPDGPTPQDPSLSPVRHFVDTYKLAHAPISGFPTPLFNATPPASSYLQPAPPPTSPPHRYVWLLFALAPGAHVPANFTTNVTNWDVGAFARGAGLGAPVGGNFAWLSSAPV